MGSPEVAILLDGRPSEAGAVGAPAASCDQDGGYSYAVGRFTYQGTEAGVVGHYAALAAAGGWKRDLP
ncbi:hypothetical protein [Kitasatospora purpeofusca]|uniref:hypothetical protein n=1 Tax=Kitasatospora purpeofusca TaxID=67352 RepID=UPI0036D376EB